jgi:hypothetical protein
MSRARILTIARWSPPLTRTCSTIAALAELHASREEMSLAFDSAPTAMVMAQRGPPSDIELARSNRAMGVETDVQADVLARMGCDQSPRYLFGRPALLDCWS